MESELNPKLPMEPTFGLDTFGSLTLDENGARLSQAQSLRDIVEQGIVADRFGVESFNVGEHHRDDFAVAAPDMVLGALSGVTENIRLGTAVIVLSSDDPVRVFERFSTLDAVSSGRAELTLGRGSFTESFPLFGYSLDDYEQLFEEKLDLFSIILKQEPVTWSGSLRAPLRQQEIYPRMDGILPTWVAVGGSPESVIRAARYGLPLKLAIIGGPADRFVPFAQLYREANEKFGHPVLPVGMHSPGHVAETDEQARNETRDSWLTFRNRLGRERGWGPAGPREFEHEVEEGSLYVGSPDTVAHKIAHAVRALGALRFDLKYDQGLTQAQMLRSIELYGTEVIPRVRALLAKDA